MSNILTIGYIGEGSTDERFLGNIIQRTFENLAIDCNGQIDVYEPQFIKISKQKFVEQILEASIKAKWYNVLCIHTDADSNSDLQAFTNKINPAIEALNKCEEDICKNVVAIVPIYMTEAWMLADLNGLIEELGTFKSINDLGLPTKTSQIENLNDPKETIKLAIANAYNGISSRRRRISIADLYSPLSQKIPLVALEALSSYMKFKNAAANSLKLLNYMD